MVGKRLSVLSWIKREIQAVIAETKDTITADRARRAESRQQTQLWERIRNRMPQSSFPIIPAIIIGQYNNPGSNLTEHLADWELLFNSYPHPPQTEADQKRMDAEFWHQQFTNNSQRLPDGTFIGLKPRQQILDHYRYQEKWLLRQYFLMTGIVVDTWYGGRFVALYKNYIECRSESRSILTILDNDEVRADTLKRRADAASRWENYIDTRDGHYERWGTWYCSNIERVRDEIRQANATDRRDYRASDEL